MSYNGYVFKKVIGILCCFIFFLPAAFAQEDELDIMDADDELVIEGTRVPQTTAKTGRSITLDSAEIKLTAEIGVIEDVMASIRLLPGVGYTGMFNAQPSIRGGTPGDMVASLDGFYIFNPYHWGGAFSIFDPKMVDNAQLYHGVFSARYGSSISGLLAITSKTAIKQDVTFELGLSTSAASFSLSHPLPDFINKTKTARGGVIVTGKVSYWDPFVWVAKGLATFVEVLEPINIVNVPPYIRSVALSANYNFTNTVEGRLNGYIGGDGVGALYVNEGANTMGTRLSNMQFDWDNLIGYLGTSATVNLRTDMLLKTMLGVSFNQSMVDSQIHYKLTARNSAGRLVNIDNYTILKNKESSVNFQARGDFDWELPAGFIFSAGMEELYRMWKGETETNQRATVELPAGSGNIVSVPYSYPTINNGALFTSVWSLAEYKDSKQRFAAELGVRMDHIFFVGNDFTVQTDPVVNPRFNFDYFPIRKKGVIDLLTLTVGTGLFSSLNDNITSIENKPSLTDFSLKQNKSSISVIGGKLDLAGGLSLNVEFYYKYIFDRSYSVSRANVTSAYVSYYFDGTGHVFGIDLMLQKLTGRFISGWISYSFNWTRYNDPLSSQAFSGARFPAESSKWYYPSFQRFSNLNIVLNIKPIKPFNIYVRFGFASGAPQAEPGSTEPYRSVEPNGSTVIKYRRINYYSDTERTPFSLPLDLKFSWYLFNTTGRVQTEIYLAIENALSLVYTPKGTTTTNPYTGEEEQGGASASFELPIPMVSFGFRWSY
ncbi:hypothetical protein FACS1894190_03410 [Spirochaetia bacterium]|nr:hypothetical protein FACS1894190_03410 [Spirochaetia bacterium]